MCIAIPGKVTEITGDRANVDFNGNMVSIHIGLVEPKVGQYVLVHAGCAIEVMEADRAQELIDLFAELEQLNAWREEKSREKDGCKTGNRLLKSI